MAFRGITDDDVLSAVVERTGDGYCLVAEGLPSLPRLGHADRRRAVHRAVSRGLLIKRRGPDGREHVAVASEGWRQLRAAELAPSSYSVPNLRAVSAGRFFERVAGVAVRWPWLLISPIALLTGA